MTNSETYIQFCIMFQGCNAISRCVVGPGAAVINCGLVSCSHPPREAVQRPKGGHDHADPNGDSGGSDGSLCCFANGLAVAVGPETRGRELACYATMTLAEAAAAAADRVSAEAVKEQRLAVDEYAELAR